MCGFGYTFQFSQMMKSTTVPRWVLFLYGIIMLYVGKLLVCIIVRKKSPPPKNVKRMQIISIFVMFKK